ncbi:hypothetical protein HK101_000391 [Irineochytrium annulatum]|nr:hypothetical protein HK101_000391 [Irineochytrium annulatum]
MADTTVPTASDVAGRLNVDVDKTVYKNPATTCDALVLRSNVKTGKFELLVIQRGRNPYKGYWALPGGFIEYGEDPEDAVRRELKEESQIAALPGSENIHLITVRGKGDRDPRQHIITIAYALKVDEKTLKDCAGSDDAKDARWISLDALGSDTHPLAFDHAKIVDSFRAWFEKEGKAKKFYVTDSNPMQPGQASGKQPAEAYKNADVPASSKKGIKKPSCSVL